MNLLVRDGWYAMMKRGGGSGDSTSRDRDRNREYESGSKKRAKKNKTDKMISELPRITSMFTPKPSATEHVDQLPN